MGAKPSQFCCEHGIMLHFSHNQRVWPMVWLHEKWNTVWAQCFSNSGLIAGPRSTLHATSISGQRFGYMKIEQWLGGGPFQLCSAPCVVQPACLASGLATRNMEQGSGAKPFQLCFERQAVFHFSCNDVWPRVGLRDICSAV